MRVATLAISASPALNSEAGIPLNFSIEAKPSLWNASTANLDFTVRL